MIQNTASAEQVAFVYSFDSLNFASESGWSA